MLSRFKGLQLEAREHVLFNPIRGSTSKSTSLRSAFNRMRLSLQRTARVYDDINAYLFALAFGLAVIDATAFAAIKVSDLAPPTRNNEPKISLTGDASDPVSQDGRFLPGGMVTFSR